jgi:branched-chain amino acid aminotransferase
MDTRYAEGCAWIDGEYLPIAEARIPITDTGFSRSDVTYDVVAVWKGRFFRLDAHLARFERSYRGLRMNPPLSVEEIREILFECVRRSGLRDAYVDMIATRGAATAATRDPRLFQNRFYAYAIPYVWIVEPEKQEKGSHIVIAERTLRIPPESVDPTIKNFHWGDLVRGTYEAYERGGEFAVLPDADGNLTEGPGFNIFAVKNDTLYTPDRGVLKGITRRTVLELAADEGLATVVAPLAAAALRNADEAFLTSTAGGVMPVTVIDGTPLASGVPGPVTLRLRQRYWDAHKDPRWSEAVD